MSYLKKLLKENPSLLMTIVDYHFFPLRSAHPDHGRIFFGEENPLLGHLAEKSLRYERCVNRLVLKSLKWEEDLHHFERREKRLLLTDSLFLEEAVFATGLVIYSGEIAKEVRGDRVRSLKKQLGQKWYYFALKKVPFFFAPLEFEVSLPHDLSDFSKECFRQGFSLWKRVLEPAGPGSFERLLIKLSSHLSDEGGTVSPFPISQEKAFSVVRRVVKSLEGGAKWLSLLQ
ncbi:MAG: SctK family type III secretion system sorting platform protein [Thermodesulforhabdaceae bacterium]